MIMYAMFFQHLLSNPNKLWENNIEILKEACTEWNKGVAQATNCVNMFAVNNNEENSNGNV
jgi:hypothetical protein